MRPQPPGAGGAGEALRQQIAACRSAGSAFTAGLFEAALADLEAGGAVARLVEGFPGNPWLDALWQRVLGGVQERVLAGEAPGLARFHPAVGGAPLWPETGRAFVSEIEAHLEEIRPALARQVQTNEVRRCAGLLGPLLSIARDTGLPLRLLEIGSSAGLHLFWERYGYALWPAGAPGSEPLCFGPHDSPVQIACLWEGSAPALDATVRVASRQGCDLAPIDVTDPAGLRRIASFYWADQSDRYALLRAAASMRTEPAPVERMEAGRFVERELASLPDGVATVLFHCTMWWYVADDEKRAIAEAVHRAGRRATRARPLFWLRSEPPSLEHVEVRLRSWPGGEDRLLARAQHHGHWVQWLG